MDIEKRANGLHITGYVNVTGKLSRPVITPHGKVLETIEERAFDRAIKKSGDISMTVDHCTAAYAKISNGTLKLSEDAIGLRAEALITDPTIIEMATKGKIKGQSFGMYNVVDELEQCVVTFKDIDMVHGRPEGTARKRFNDNRKYFVEGEDFFLVKPADIQMSEIRPSEINNRGTILLTESGYLMIVKSFTDDLAWSVQRELVKTYFRARQMEMSYNNIILKVLENQEEMKKEIVHIQNDINKLDKKFDCTENILRKLLSENNSIMIPAFISLNNSIGKIKDDVSRIVKNIITYYLDM